MSTLTTILFLWACALSLASTVISIYRQRRLDEYKAKIDKAADEAMATTQNVVDYLTEYYINESHKS